MELKDILTFTGIEAENIEDFKANFEKTFLKKDAALKDKEFVNSVVGKRMFGIANKLKNQFIKYGVEFSDDDLKTKPIEDLIESGLDIYTNSTNTTITELTEKAKQNSTEKFTELETKYSKLESKYNDTVKASKTTAEEFNNFKLKAADDLKGVKISTIKEQALSKIPRRSDVEEKQYALSWEGFETRIDKKFKIDLDENGKDFIADKTTGERFRDPARASEFLSVEQVLRKEADEVGLTPKNPFKPPAPAPKPIIQQNQNGNGQGSMPARPTATPRR